ncbi:MAG: DUF222 domain-containing protein [Acidimicrobiales bacterium]
MDEALQAVIDELLALDPASLDEASLHELVVDLERQSSRLAAVRAKVVARWDAVQSWADDGSKSPRARLGRECRLSPRVAGAEVRRARKLRHMPHTASALAAGDVSVDHVTMLASCNSGRLRGLFARDEELLVGEARRLCFTDFVQVLALWRQNADDAADADDADRAAHQHHDRFFDAARTFQGTVDLRGLLDPINGEIVLNELHRLEQRLFEADWAEARERLGAKATAADLCRTPSQRRADALVEMAQRSAAMAPGARAARPLITILWGANSFRDALCETDHGVTLNPHQVIPLLSDADIERIVFGADSRVLDVGVRERFFTGALRRAIEVRDRHCAHPSDCHVPAPDCHVDHSTDYATGGLTTQDNGQLLCAVHNRTKRRRGPPIRNGP